jgi:hypothetical protein
MFLKLKKHVWGLRFESDEGVKEEVKRRLRQQGSSFYHQGFDCLIYCRENCLSKYGDYVEKQWICAYIQRMYYLL